MQTKEENMNRILLLAWLLTIGFGNVLSQDVSLWMRLTEDRVLNDSRFRYVNDDTLFVVSGNRFVSVPLVELVQLRAMRDSSITNGILIGSGCGLVLGGFIDVSLSTMDKPVNPRGVAWLACAVLGGIIGGTIAALEKPGDLISLEGMNSSEKARLISAAVRRAAISRP
jgi:hypothetical protein